MLFMMLPMRLLVILDIINTKMENWKKIFSMMSTFLFERIESLNAEQDAYLYLKIINLQEIIWKYEESKSSPWDI